MTKKLIDKLRLKIDKLSLIVVITTTDIRMRALGQINNIKIAIQDILLSSTFQNSDSRDEFGEYIYEDEELVKAEEYYTEENTEERNKLFYNS
ncbi:11087_t:CDS:2 [Scutellospora calospora]|uniref:11087_t:CDS:1 n=1 Tax=Scutellospora calospora TaxID=85575 RepID=A0ACA9KJZ1_9GLOM|nr:11087_t:CDS:2 [Scutellospora calospora]